MLGNTVKTKVVFVDIDHTLYVSDPFRIAWCALIRGRFIDRVLLLKSFILSPMCLLLYKCSGLKAMSWLLLRIYRGHPLESIRHFFEQIYTPSPIPEAIAKIHQHKDRNHHICSITASPTMYFEKKMKDLGVDEIFGIDFETKDGIVVRPVRCIDGDEKVKIAQSVLRRLGIGWEDAYFYTDSYRDLPLLEKVAHPVMVRPDRKLLKIGSTRGYTVLKKLDMNSTC